MKVVTKDFLNENNYRQYPIDVLATYEPYTAADISIVNSLLTDMRLTVPAAVANSAFIANINVSSAIVSMVIMGVQTAPYFTAGAQPATTYESAEYTAFDAVVLGTVTVLKSIAKTGTPVAIAGQIPGVGGWVTFGNGINLVASWSFAGPSSATLCSSVITRYDYGGVTTLAKAGFTQLLDGALTMVGQNGIVATTLGQTISLGFGGSVTEVKEQLAKYVGECGKRPETDTCSFKPIKQINGIKPETSNDGFNEIVLVLAKPLYGKLKDTDISLGGFQVGSDLALEDLAGPRLRIPNIECTDPALTLAANTGPATRFIATGTEVLLEVSYGVSYEYYSFKAEQQHPYRAAITIFKPTLPGKYLLGEQLVELHLDTSLNQWQVYTNVGPSLNLFGPLQYNLTGYRATTFNGIPYQLLVGPPNALDAANYNALVVNTTVSLPWAGTYLRRSYGQYVHTVDATYSTKVLTATKSWGIYQGNNLLAGGPLEANGFGSYIQHYTDSANQTQFRTISVMGKAL